MTAFVLHGGWLTTKEVAELLRVHPKHVYRLLKQGLPGRQVGTHWRFSPPEVREWMARGRPRRGSTKGNKALQSATSSNTTALVASAGDLAIDALVQQVNCERPTLGLVQADAATALDWLAAEAVLAVGVLGDCQAPSGANLARLHLAYEQFGLAAAPGREAPALTTIGTRRERLASWPSGSDLRSQLDGVLRREGIDPQRPHARALVVGSHGEIVSALLCGRATIGVTTAAWARRCALPFTPLGSRPLSLVVQAASLGHPALIRCWQVAQSLSFGDAATELGGLDVSDAGQIDYLMDEMAMLPARNATEASSQSHHEAPWVLMLRSRGAAASQALTDLAKGLRGRGLSVAGFVQVPRRRGGEVVAYELRRLVGTDRVVVARRGRTQGGTKLTAPSFKFVPEAFAEALRWLKQDGRDARVLIVDGIGTLEGRGKGHHDALAWAAGRRAPKVVVAALRRDQASVISSRLGLGSRQLAIIEASAGEAERARLVEAIIATTES